MLLVKVIGRIWYRPCHVLHYTGLKVTLLLTEPSNPLKIRTWSIQFMLRVSWWLAVGNVISYRLDSNNNLPPGSLQKVLNMLRLCWRLFTTAGLLPQHKLGTDEQKLTAIMSVTKTCSVKSRLILILHTK